MLVRVEAPHFVAGIVLDHHERCISAAPILRWAIGLDRLALREEFARRGWKATVVKSLRKASEA
jgi:hypothetical protein